jgi:hypothetical protein
MATSALVDNATRTSSTGTSPTVTGAGFGSAFAGRVLVVEWASIDLGTAPTAATIGGVSATIIGTGLLGLAAAVVPSGTSGNIVFTTSSSDTIVTNGVVALTGAANATPSDTIVNYAGASGNIDVGAAGALVAFAYNNPPPDGAWTGATGLRTDSSLGAALSTASFDNGGGALTNRAVSYSTGLALIAAAFDADAGGGLSPSLFTDTDTFFSATVVGSQSLTASLYSDTDSFFSSTVLNRGDLIGTLQANNNSIPASFSATGSVAVEVGDLIVSVVCQQTNLTVTGVTDNLGNTYTAQNAGTDAGNVTGRVYYSIATNAGTLTSVTAACSSSTNDGVHIVGVWKGKFSAIDVNIANTTGDVSSPYSCPATGTLAQAAELVVSWGVASYGTSWSASSPMLMALQLANSTTIKAALAAKVVSATTTTTPAFTAASNPGQAVLGTLSFKMDLTQPLVAALFDDSDAFFSATVDQAAGGQALTASLFADSDAFFTHVVTTGAVGLTAGLFVDTDAFFGPTASPGTVGLTASLFSDNETFFASTVSGSYALTVPLYADTDSVYSATITVGGVVLTASLFSDGDSFFSATVASASDLTPSLFTDSDAFFSAVVSPGGVALTAGLYADTDVFHDAVVSSGGALLAPDVFVDSDAFHSATVAPGSVGLTAALFTDSDAFFSATIGRGAVGLAAALFSETDTFFTPVLSVGAAPLTASLFVEGDAFHDAVVSAGGSVLAPVLVVDNDAFFSAALSRGAVDLGPVLFEDADIFHSATVTVGSVSIAPDLFADNDNFYSPTVNLRPLVQVNSAAVAYADSQQRVVYAAPQSRVAYADPQTRVVYLDPQQRSAG